MAAKSPPAETGGDGIDNRHSGGWGSMIQRNSFTSSVLSGVLGATASCWGKCALDPDSFVIVWMLEQTAAVSLPLFLVEYATRGILFLAMLACNALMLGAFVRGLEQAGSITGSALSTAANFITSALLGYWVWNETFHSLWWVGLGMIFVGMVLLTTSTSVEGASDTTLSSSQVTGEDPKTKVQ